MTSLRSLGLSFMTALSLAACQKAPERTMEVRSYDMPNGDLYGVVVKEVPVSLQEAAGSARHAFERATPLGTTPDKALSSAYHIADSLSTNGVTVSVNPVEKNMPMTPEGTFYFFTASKGGATYTAPPLHSTGRIDF